MGENILHYTFLLPTNSGGFYTPVANKLWLILYSWCQQIVAASLLLLLTNCGALCTPVAN
jgi:hypothetical protein